MHHLRAITALFSLPLVVVACGGSVSIAPAEPTDAAQSDAADAVADALDAPIDASFDANPDANFDADADADADFDALPTHDAVVPPADGPLDATPDAPATTSARPPPRPPTTVTGGTTRWYAIKKYNLGVADRSGLPSASAWKDYGYDLDGFATTSADSKSDKNTACNRRAGAPTSVLTDGHDGRDNNFGSQFMSLMKALISDAEDRVNAAVASGGSTLLLRLDNVPTDGSDGDGVTGALYAAGTAPFTPTFTTADHWPVRNDSLVDVTKVGDASNAKWSFPKGYIAHGYWVSGDFDGGTTTLLPLTFSGALLNLPLHSTVLAFNLADGSDGTIAGGSPVAALVDALTPTMEGFGICPGNATFDAVVTTLSQGADLAVGYPHFTAPSAICDTMSVGLGFSVAPTGAPSGPVAPTTPTKVCTP